MPLKITLPVSGKEWSEPGSLESDLLLNAF